MVILDSIIHDLTSIPIWLVIAMLLLYAAIFLIASVTGREISFLGFKVGAKENKGNPSEYVERFPQLLDFHETFKKVDWKGLIESSEKSIDIVVYYFDSWVNQNEESLEVFLKKSKTKIRVIVADPEDPTILENVNRLFPEYSRETIREKVAHTRDRFLGVFDKVGASQTRFEMYYYPHFLNYSMQILDDKILCLSIFEMYREQKIDSPALVIDLSKSKHISNFTSKELGGIIKESKRVF